MKIDPKAFRLPPGKKPRLARHPTRIDPFYVSKEEYREMLGESSDAVSEQQRLLYSSGTHALLLIFQGMDASGKDGAIRTVMGEVDPQGCQVYSFKQPSPEELRHDFMWRTNVKLPERGRIGIFNRSYYEEVLVVKVHPEYLRAQGMQPEAATKAFWEGRYRSIIDSERHLHREGTRILKFYLHLSQDEQRRRFLDRIDEPEKHWKFDLGDIRERARWGEYMRAYEECLAKTGIAEAPWHIVPADDKKNARLIISAILLDALKAMKMSYPRTSPERLRELKKYRGLLSR